jgi:hypothetical protein
MLLGLFLCTKTSTGKSLIRLIHFDSYLTVYYNYPQNPFISETSFTPEILYGTVFPFSTLHDWELNET